MDAEELLECLESGRGHPVLRRWQKLKAESGRPGPTRRDLRVRRLIVLAVIALQRVVSRKQAPHGRPYGRRHPLLAEGAGYDHAGRGEK